MNEDISGYGESRAQCLNYSRRKLLEVIVTSVEEAHEAEAGGADRLELVRALDQGGLTPSLQLVESVLACVAMPLRVMVRENATMSVSEDSEVIRLEANAAAFSKLPVDGLVTGFTGYGRIDTGSLRRVANAAPLLPITFHRAFESVIDPKDQLNELKTVSTVDRILIRSAGRFSLPYLAELQEQAEDRIRVIAGTGLDSAALAGLAQYPTLREVHVGRAAREPATAEGKVSRAKIAAIKKVLS